MKPRFNANYLPQRNTKNSHFLKFQLDNKLHLKYLHIQTLILITYKS